MNARHRRTHDRHVEYRLAFIWAQSYLRRAGRKGKLRTVLYDFLTSKREEIIARAKSKVAARSVPRVTEAELAHGVPLFFEQLIAMLKDSERTSDEMKASATKHGNDMVRMGFTVAQVVHDYGNVCQAVTELAFELGAAITLDEFHTLNRCLHDAIAQAVTEYGRLRERSLTEQGTERIGVLAHDMRNRLTTALLSLESLKAGRVSISGSTGALLDRSLTGLNDLIERSLAETRKASTNGTRETVEVVDDDGPG
jgi:RsbT co-antagonist protein rsbRD N-terminal domain